MGSWRLNEWHDRDGFREVFEGSCTQAQMDSINANEYYRVLEEKWNDSGPYLERRITKVETGVENTTRMPENKETP